MAYNADGDWIEPVPGDDDFVGPVLPRGVGVVAVQTGSDVPGATANSVWGSITQFVKQLGTTVVQVKRNDVNPAALTAAAKPAGAGPLGLSPALWGVVAVLVVLIGVAFLGGTKG